MNILNLLVVKFLDLTWWQMCLWVVYTIYFLHRSYNIWDEVSRHGFKRGYRFVMIGHWTKELKLYHVIRMVFDIPPMIIGLTFPTFKKIFGLKLYTFNDEKGKQK